MQNDLIYMVRCIPTRMKYVLEMKKQIPELITFQDRDGCAMLSFIKALTQIGEQRAVLFEDDIILTSNFKEKALAVIKEHPDTIINFFTGMSKTAYPPEWRTGSRFTTNLCTYYPEGYAIQIAEYSDRWERRAEHPTGYDYMIADWLKGRKEKYFQHSPSLVQHRIGVSSISSRRSRNRQCIIFET